MKEIADLLKYFEMKPMIYKERVNKITEDCILCKGQYAGYNFLIITYGSHPCAYVEIPESHPLYNQNYSNIIGKIANIPHGGFTFGETTIHSLTEKEGWWLGWDYAHAFDYVYYTAVYTPQTRYDKKWTTEEILKNVIEVIDGLRSM